MKKSLYFRSYLKAFIFVLIIMSLISIRTINAQSLSPTTKSGSEKKVSDRIFIAGQNVQQLKSSVNSGYPIAKNNANFPSSLSYKAIIETIIHQLNPEPNDYLLPSPAIDAIKAAPPAITCPGNLSSPADLGFCTASLIIPPPVLFDPDGDITTLTYIMTGATNLVSPIAGINYIPTPFQFNVGLTSITYTVTDLTGTSVSCSFTVTVNDTQFPVITCPGNINTTYSEGLCNAIISIVAPVPTDNCPGVTVSGVRNDLLPLSDPYPTGTTTITWTATDVNGNSSTCTQTIKVTEGNLLVNYDFIGASAYPISPNQSATGIACMATSSETFNVLASVGTVTGALAFIDNLVANPAIYMDPSTGTNTRYFQFHLSGDSLYKYRKFKVYVQAQRGNRAAQTINFAYSTDPVSYTVNGSLVLNASGTWYEKMIDWSSINRINNRSDLYIRLFASNGTGGVGDGRLFIDNFQVIGVDGPLARPNSVSLPENSTITIPVQSNDYFGCHGPALASPVSLVTSPTKGTTILNPDGTFTYTTNANVNGPDFFVYQICDASGSCDTSIVRVNIIPVNYAPSIICPDNVSSGSDIGLCAARVFDLEAVYNDPDGISDIVSLTWTMTGANNDFSDPTGINNLNNFLFNFGITTVTYTVTDADGLSASCSFTVQIYDSEPPSIICPSDTTITIPDCFSFAAGVNLTPPTVADPCGALAPTNDAPAQFPEGNTIVTWTVFDVNGLSSSCEQVVTIVKAPAISLTMSTTPVSCFGGSNGTATVTVSGGYPPYTYLWNTVPAQIAPTVLNLLPGTYTVIVSDTAGCIAVDSITVTQPAAALSAAIASHQDACFGQANGTATASATGGTQPYSYTWNTLPVQTNATAINLITGTYIVTITDIRGCSDTASVFINQPDSSLIATIMSHQDDCFGGANGSATVTATGGTLPYTYSWNTIPVQTTQTAINLVAGTYIATVTDAGGCTDTAIVVINQPASALIATIVNHQDACFGQANGSATVSASGGSLPYSYSWNTVPVQITQTAVNLLAGTYNATVTDAGGCTDTASVVISQPASAIVATIPFHADACFGQADGSATVSATGGTLPYTYSWNTIPVQTTATAVNMVAGTYIATVTDAGGCTDTASVVISQPDSALIATVTSHQNGCFGQTNGSATVSATGGTQPYSYSWNTIPAQTTATVINLTGGTYIATITDAGGCTDTARVIINPPTSALIATITGHQDACFGQANGNAIGSATGGAPPYTYSWNTIPFQTTPTATNLAAGTYILTVTDDGGCMDTASVVISQPASALIASISSHQDACFGQANGNATVIANGGTLPYTYSWNTIPVQTNATAGNLVAGTYIVTVSDAGGCSDTASITITQPPAGLVASITSKQNACFGEANGTATVNAIGGTLPYIYSWNTIPVQTTQTAINLIAGTYIATVTDAGGCSDTARVFITQPAAALIASISSHQNACFGQANGSATVNATGGTLPYTYSWNTIPFQTTQTVINLVAGTYIATVTDAGGCEDTASVVINQPATALVATISSHQDACFGQANGNATVGGNGGTLPYTYSWNTIPVQTTATAFNLSAGTYIATVTDAGGCQDTASITITQPASGLLASIISHTDIACFGQATGNAVANASGGVLPYNFSWNTIPVQNTNTASNLAAGTYIVTVSDASGCPDTASVVISQPATALTGLITSLIPEDCAGNANGSVTIIGNGGTSPYQFSFNGGIYQVSGTFNNLTAGSYVITVRDTNNCTFPVPFEIKVSGILSAVNDFYSTAEDTPVSSNVMTNDLGLCNPPIIVTSNTIPANGSVVMIPDGSFTYTPGPNYNGSDFFLYTITDNLGATSTATVFITISAVNDPPVTFNEYDTLVYNTPISGNVLANGDYDPDSTALSVNTTPIVNAGNGTFTILADGSYVYTPNLNFIGNDMIVVSVCDEGIPLPPACTNDTIFINVLPPNQPPVTVNENITVCQAISFSGTVFNGDSDPENNLPLTLNPVLVIGPSHGTLAITDTLTGTFVYVSDSSYSGPDMVVVSICDSGIPVECSNDTIFITVIPTIIANAGPSQKLCNANVTFLIGNNPAPGTGIWAFVSGPNIPVVFPPTGSVAIAAGLIASPIPYVFGYTITSSNGCVSTDTMSVINYNPPTPAYAGMDQEYCDPSGILTINLAANTPVFGTGIWTQLSGPNTAVIADTTDPNASVSGLTFGTYAFQWAISNGICQVSADVVNITISAPAIVYCGPDDTICEGSVVALNSALASNYVGLLWSSTGTGIFNDPTAQNPVYTPSITDITNGLVVLTLTATANSPCLPVSDQLTLLINHNITVNAGSDTTICEGSAFTISSATSSNQDSLTWTSSGIGTLTGKNTLNPTYIPAINETGDITFVLTGFAFAPCPNVSDTMILHINPAAIVNAGSDDTICEGSIYSLTGASAINNTGLLWTTSGTGTFNDATIQNPVYTPGASDISNGSVNLILTAFATVPCANQSDTLTLIITRSPTADAGPDTTICQISSFTVTQASALFAASVNWTSNGSGTLANANTISPTYTPALAESGNVTLKLTAFGNYPCGAAIDSMIIHISPATSAFAGPDSTICEGSTYTLSAATAGINTGVLWTTSGTGTFNDATILNPVYTPDASDIAIGSVNLILTVFATVPCGNQSDTATIVIIHSPIADAGPDTTICQGNNITLSGRALFNTSVLWSTSGTGSFSDATSLTPTYIPGPAETGTITLTLTAFGNAPCNPFADDMVLTITPVIPADAGPNFQLCNVNATFLVGNNPSPGTGSWSFVSGPNTPVVFPPTGSVAIAAGLIASPIDYVFRYTIVNNGCSSSDTVIVTNFNLPSAAYAGPDQPICDASENVTISLAANTPAFGSGVWTQMSGPNTAIITDISDPNTTVTNMTPGFYTFRWTITNGNCASTLDDVNIIISSPATAFAGNNDTICEGSAFSLSSAMASNYSSLQWRSTGTGIFDNPTILQPVYTPSITDIINGQVVLTLTAGGNATCPDVQSQLTLTIRRTPVVFAGADTTICQGISYTINDAVILYDSAFTWTSSGAGILSGETTMQPTYTPALGETGDVTIVLTGFAFAPCASVKDTMIIHINPLASVFAGPDDTICEVSTYLLFGATANNATGLLWSTSGTGNFSDPTIQNPVYTPSPIDIVDGSVILRITASANPGCGDVHDEMQLIIKHRPVSNAGPDNQICQNASFTVTQASTLFASSYGWTTNGAGILAGANTLSPTYTPASGESGDIMLTLTATGFHRCADSVDFMILHVSPSASANAGFNLTSCEATPVTLNGSSASGNSGLLWTTSGSGTFNNPAILHPVYTPSAADVTTGLVTLTLTAYGFDPCPDEEDDMVLTINRQASAYAGMDGSVCEGNTYTVFGASAQNYASVIWTHDGAGTLAGANTLNPVYTPASGETGNVTLTLTAIAYSPCTNAVDHMVITILPNAQANAGPDDKICEGFTYLLSGATISANTGLLWTTSGNGTFDDPTILHPVYTPGINDITMGFANLTLTAYANSPCEDRSDMMTLIISRSPSADAGPDAKICQGETFTVGGASVTNSISLLWTSSGTGTLTDATTLIPTYTPASGETGVVTLLLTAVGNAPCNPVVDTMFLTIIPAAQAYAGPDDTICQGSTFKVTDATAVNNFSLVWSTSGTGTFDNATLLNTVYTPSVNDIANGFVTLTITANGNPSCPSAVDDMKLFITGYPVTNAGPNAIVCEGVPFTVSGATAANFSAIQWTTTGSGVLTNASSLTPTYTPAIGETGTIQLSITVFGNTGCGIVTAFSNMDLKINKTVVANAGSDVTIPPNSTIQLHGSATGGSGQYQYNWLPADELTFETTESPTTLPLNVDTQFIMVVTDMVSGCRDSDTMNIFMSNDQNLPPVAIDDYDTTNFQEPVTIRILANDSDPENSILHMSFCGYPSNGLVTANSDGSITYTPYSEFSGDDQLCYVICDSGIPVLCDTATVYIHVLVKPSIEDVFVYNGFSPNGDGNNDFLVIKGIEAFPDNEIIIYNRYGDKIRALSHYDNHDVIWDGSNTDGKPIPDGTYFYVLKIKDQTSRTGWIFIRGKK